MTILDHLAAFALTVVWPVLGTRAYRRFALALASGVPGARGRHYRSTIAEEWVLVAVVLVLWLAQSRAPAQLGLTFGPPSRWVFGLGATVLIIGLLAAQGRALRNLSPANRIRIRAQLGQAALLLPVTDREYRLFGRLAATAGICEEVLFRGYLIWYAGAFAGPWFGAVLAAAAFGLGHAYQGREGILKTGGAGLVMGALYVGTGSLLWPVIVHTAVDLQGGTIGRAALAES